MNRSKPVLTKNKVLKYLNLLKKKGYSDNTIKRKVAALLKFTNYAYESKLIHHNQFQEIKNILLGKKPNFTLNLPRPKIAGFKALIPKLKLANLLGLFLLMAFAMGSGIGIYNQFFRDARINLAAQPGPVRAGRIINFQGFLTDSNGTPIVNPINMRYKLYNADSGGDVLYDTGSCSVEPDNDGIVNVLIGTNSPTGGACWDGNEIPAEVFSMNPNVYLGVTVGTDPEMTDRQQIANVGYAINAELLQGYPLGTSSASVPFINGDGDLLIAATTPSVSSINTSANFRLSSANAITIASAGSGDILLQASESGAINLRTGGITDAYSRLYITNSGNVGIGTTTPSSKLDVNGTVTMSGLKLTTSPSAGYVLSSDASGNGTWTDVSSTAGPWTLASNNLYPDSTNYNVGIGATNPGTAKLYVNGNVGIGTTAPGGKLDIYDGTYGSALKVSQSANDYLQYQSRNFSINAANSHNNPFSFTLNSSGTDFAIQLGQNTTYDLTTRLVSSNGYSFKVGNITESSATTAMYLSSDANVGIGTTAPAYKLDVSGDVYSSANLRAATDLYIAGTALSANSSTTSGASKIGLYKDTMTYVTADTNVQNAIKELDSAIGTISGGSVTGTGTTNYVTKWSSATGLTDSSIYDNGNVGIGTTTPGTYKLNIVGNTYLDGTLTTTGAITAPTSTNTINNLIINSGALSGVTGYTQTNGALAFSGGGNFSVDSAAFDVTTGGAVSGVTTLSMNNQLTNSYANTAAINLTGNASGITFGGTGVNQIITGGTNALALMPGGNVGIGTTAPGAKLDVDGNILVQGGGSIDTRAAGTLTIGGTTQTGLVLGRSGQSTKIANLTTNGVVYTSSGDGTLNSETALDETRGGTGQTTITQGDLLYGSAANTLGKLGIGTSGYALMSNGTIPSWVDASSLGTNYWTLSGSNLYPNQTTYNVGVGTTTPGSLLSVAGGLSVGSTYAAVVAPINGAIFEGSVGIGTTNPNFLLDIKGDSGGRFINTSLNSGIYIDPVNNRIGTNFIANNLTLGGANNLIFETYDSGWTPRMYISNTGNVGIGTTAPGYKLHVNGNVGIESTIYAPNIGAGTDDSVVVLNSSGNLVTDEIDSRVWGTTLVDGTGTTNYNAYWSDGNTLAAEQYVATSRGGLGANVTAAGAGEILYSTATTTYGHLAAGTSGMALISGGAGAPSWGTLGLTYGGTNANLSGVDTGGLIYKGASALAGTAALSGIIQGNGASAPTAITGTANYIPKWSASAPYLTATSTIYDNGNVGIGTTVPTGKLEVAGTVYGQSVFSFGDSTPDGNAYNTIGTGDKAAAGVNDENDLYVTDYIEAGTGLCIGSDCKTSWASVGGYWTRTAGNLYPTTVNDTISATSSAATVATFTQTDSAKLALRAGGNTNASTLNILGSGNVGIGTTLPTGKLTIKGAGTTTGINLQTQNSSGTALITALDNANVGIGITAPTAGLEILKTTTQLKLSYDSSNYSTFAINNAGNLTILPSGKDILVTGDGTRPRSIIVPGSEGITVNSVSNGSQFFTGETSGYAAIVGASGEAASSQPITVPTLGLYGKVGMVGIAQAGGGGRTAVGTYSYAIANLDAPGDASKGIYALTNGIGSSVDGKAYGVHTKVDLSGTTAVTGFGYGLYSEVTGVANNTTYAGYFTASGGTTNYGVYSAAGTNYFNANTGIGTTTPGYKLEVSGTSYFSGASVFNSTIGAANIGADTDNSVVILNGSGLLKTDEIDSRVWDPSSLVDGTGTTNYNAYWSDSNTLAAEQYVATSRGGLGANVTAAGAGELLYSTATTTYGHLAAGTSGMALISGGAGAPSWGTLGLTYGGTNANLSGVDTGGLIYKGASALAGTGALTGVLKGNGSSAPSAMTSTANYVTYWSDNNTISGEANLSVSRGGTGAGTFTKGILVSPGTTSAFTTVAGTDNYLLKWSSSYPTTTSTIWDDGNVGIGTTVPGAYKLNVNGNVYLPEATYLGTTSTYFNTSGALVMGTQNITSVGTNITASGALTVGTGSNNNLTLTAGTGTVTLTGTNIVLGAQADATNEAVRADRSLTFTQDTNVTITNSGSAQDLTANRSWTLGWTGQLSVSRGGTNTNATPTAGGVAYGTGSAYAFTGVGTTGYLLTSNGAGTPTWTDPGTLSASSKWNAIQNPDGNQGLGMTTHLTTWTWATGTGTNDLFNITTDASANGTGSLVNIYTATGATVNPLRVRAVGTEAVFVNNVGNVGIGTTSPGNYKLNIQGNSYLNGALTMTNQLTNSYANTAAINLTGNASGITFGGTGVNQIITGGTNALALMPGGNVGIGTTAPTDKLDVVGEIDTSTYYKLGNLKILDMKDTSSLLVGHYAGAANSGGTNNVYMGYYAAYLQSTGNYNTYIGYLAGYGSGTPTGSENTALGSQSLQNIESTAQNNVALGASTATNLTTGSYNVFLGSWSDQSGGAYNYSLALGYSAIIGSNKSIALGTYATTTADNQLVVGASGYEITHAYFGEGVTSTSAGDITLNATGGSGTDNAGANLIFAGGKATGNADSGDIIFQTGDAGSTGTTLQTLTEKFRITDEGNVGIGITAPAYKLDVNGNLRVQTLAGGSTDTVVTHASGVLQTRSIDTRVWGSSLVDGSGATNRVAYWTDTETLTSSANFTFNGTYVATNEIRALSASGLSLIDDSGTATNGIFIQDGGNVGIGIVAPTTKLHVEGTITGQVFSDTNASYYLNPDSSAISLLVAGNVGIGITTPTAKLHIWQNAATDAFRVDDEGTAGDTTPFVVKDTGRVGIGAATPGGKLIVVGEGATTGITFQTQDSGNNALVTMLDNGNVGIGVTNPSQKFDVVGNIELNQYLYFANGSTEYLRWDTSDFILSDDFLPSAADTSNLGSTAAEWNSLYLANGTGLAAGGGLFLGSGQEFLLSYDSATALALKLSDGTNTFLSVKDQGTVADFAFNVDDFWISNTGNVGIGITSPIAKLHIYDASQNNLFRIANSTTDALFEVTQASMSANIPASFNAAGDTEIAYNLNFSNDTASYIRSLSPLYIEAGDSNSAEDLILRSRGTGDVIIGNSTSYFYNDGSFEVKDGSSSRFYVDATTGSIGIGTSSDILNSINVIKTAANDWATIRLSGGSNAGSGLRLYRGSDARANSITTYNANGNIAWSFGHGLYNSGGATMDWGVSAGSANLSDAKLLVKADGNVGIGTNTPSGKLHVAGTAYLPNITTTSTTSGYNYLMVNTTSGEVRRYTSALKYKENIQDLKIDPDKVLKLRPVSYTDIGTKEYGLGLIAEEVYQYIPELTIRDTSGNLEGVSYPLLSVYQLAVLKKHQALINNISLDSIGYLVIEGSDGNYAIKDTKISEYLTKMATFAEVMIAKISAGFITTKELVVETMATVQGNLSVLGNVNVNGTLTAQNITSPTITNIETNLQALTTKVNNLQTAMDAVITQDVNTGKYFMSAEALTTVNLTVQDGANIASINISGNTMSTPLAELNLKALEKVTFFNDRVLVNKDGSIMAKGEIVTQKGIKVINEAEETVASINASGSAYFAEGVTFDKNIASSSAVIAASQTFSEIGENTNSIITNGEASGQAVLPAGQQELLIRNGKVKTNSLIYISPEGSTSGQVLYLDTKKENEWFKVKVDEPSSADIKFNWWIL